MKRLIMSVDPARCMGCGACLEACSEGALALQEGRASLSREALCCGEGLCLASCPEGALRLVEAEAPAFDAELVGLSLLRLLAPWEDEVAHAVSPGSRRVRREPIWSPCRP